MEISSYTVVDWRVPGVSLDWRVPGVSLDGWVLGVSLDGWVLGVGLDGRDQRGQVTDRRIVVVERESGRILTTIH